MTKEKALYQLKLILDNLCEEDYQKILQEDIDFINDNMEYSEDITIDPSIPIEEQNIDEKAYDYLEKIIEKAERKHKEQEAINKKYENCNRDSLIAELEKYKEECKKIDDTKSLLEEYRKLVSLKDDELKKSNDINKDLYNSIQKCPKLIKKIYFKDFEAKLLK